MLLYSHATCSLLLTASLSLAPAAQSAQQTKPSQPLLSARETNTETALTPAQERALGLLDQLFEGTRGFDDGDLKITVQGQIADALWQYDEPRARRQFEDAFRSISSVKLVEQQGNTSSSTSTLEIDTLSDERKLELRSEILKLISRRDLGLAERLAKSVADAPNHINDATSNINPDQWRTLDSESQSEQAELYLEMAMSIAATDPQRAVQLTKTSLNSGIKSALLLDVLQAIRREKPALADGLFSYALSVAGRDTANLSSNISLLTQYVFPDYGAGSISASFGSDHDPGTTGQTRPALTRQFLNFVYQAMMRQPTAVPSPSTVTFESLETGTFGRPFNTQITLDFLILQQMLSFFDQFMPAKSGMIRARLDEIIYSVPPDAGRDLLTNFNHPASLRELLSQAERAETPLEKDSLYMQAAMLASRAGDTDQALLIAEKISAERIGTYDIKSSVRYEGAMAALKKKDVETAYRYSKELPDLQQRALVFGQIVRILFAKKDTVRAMEVLSDAEKSIGKADEGPEKARALLIIAGAAARLDPMRGFEVMRTAVKAINHASFVPQWQNDLTTTTGGSSRMTGITFGLNTLNFDQVFPLLARADFDGALLLAQAIEKKEASVLAQLSVCRGALNKLRAPQDKEKEKSKKPTTQETLGEARRPENETKGKEPHKPKQSGEKTPR